MELMSGYKKTEVGVVPEDWVLKPLSELFTFSGGFSASRAQLSDSGYCYLHYGDIHLAAKTTISTESDLQDIPRLNVSLDDISPKSLLRDGDVVFVDASEDDEGASKHVVVENSSNVPFISGLHTIVAKGLTNELSKSYRRYCFRTEAIRQQFQYYAVGTKVKGISKTNIAKLWLPIPPPSEQHAIATALNDIDALLTTLEKLISKKCDLKRAAMEQLLTGKTRLPGFVGKWQEKKLGEVISSCSSGATPRRNRPDFFRGNIRWINSGELNYNYITDTAEKITEDAVNKTNLRILPVGTFLMAITGLEAEGTRGACGIVGSPATTNQSCMAIFPTKDLESKYLFHYYVYCGKSLALQYCQGTKQQSYTAKLVKQLPISLPPTVEEQLAISSMLDDMDKEITSLRQRLEKTESLKQAMMHALLTGKTRLTSGANRNV